MITLELTYPQAIILAFVAIAIMPFFCWLYGKALISNVKADLDKKGEAHRKTIADLKKTIESRDQAMSRILSEKNHALANAKDAEKGFLHEKAILDCRITDLLQEIATLKKNRP